MSEEKKLTQDCRNLGKECTQLRRLLTAADQTEQHLNGMAIQQANAIMKMAGFLPSMGVNFGRTLRAQKIVNMKKDFVSRGKDNICLGNCNRG